MSRIILVSGFCLCMASVAMGQGPPATGGPPMNVGGPSVGGGGGGGGWKHYQSAGFPKHSRTLTVNPGSYDWEGSETSTTTQDGQRRVEDGQLIYSTAGGASSIVQGNIDNSWTPGDESLQLFCQTKQEFSHYWVWEGDPTAFQPIDFGGSASLSFSLAVSGTTGRDSGAFFGSARNEVRVG